MNEKNISTIKQRILSMNPKVGAKNMAQVYNKTIEEYFSVTESEEVKALVSSIRSTNSQDERRS